MMSIMFVKDKLLEINVRMVFIMINLWIYVYFVIVGVNYVMIQHIAHNVNLKNIFFSLIA